MPHPTLSYACQDTPPMCGIFLSDSPVTEETRRMLQNRGPSHYAEKQFSSIYTASSVLSIRGSIPQPYGEADWLLFYNGEIYNNQPEDTLYIANIIRQVSKQASGTAGAPEDTRFIEQIYRNINRSDNEAAIAILRSDRLFFFKDDIGRRSLGITLGHNTFTLSSVQYAEDIDPLRLYIYDFTTHDLRSIPKPPSTPLSRKCLSALHSMDWALFCPAYLTEHPYLGRYPGHPPGGHRLDSPCCTGHHPDSHSQHPTARTTPSDSSATIEKYIRLLKQSIAHRLPPNNSAPDAVVAFSGGIDSVVIALFLHLCLPPGHRIILVNTSFRGMFDREKGLEAHAALSDRFPDRHFLFVENDLSVDEIQSHLPAIIRLAHPKKSRMAINISTIHYFTARAASSYGSILFLGSGADELFAGYSRYKNELGQGASGAFRQHMLFDLLTISSHNISRDDRAISHWGMEARLPFLDRDVVHDSLSLPDWMLISEQVGRTENKHIIRALLRHYGLDAISATPKKAIQYGAGIQAHEKLLSRRPDE